MTPEDLSALVIEPVGHGHILEAGRRDAKFACRRVDRDNAASGVSENVCLALLIAVAEPVLLCAIERASFGVTHQRPEGGDGAIEPSVESECFLTLAVLYCDGRAWVPGAARTCVCRQRRANGHSRNGYSSRAYRGVRSVARTTTSPDKDKAHDNSESQCAHLGTYTPPRRGPLDCANVVTPESV